MIDEFFLTNSGAQIVTILTGIVVLLLGRRLFWLALGALGFIFGLILALQFVSGQPDWVVLIVALAAGGIGILLAILVQQIAVGVAGFIMGGFTINWLLSLFDLELGPWAWVFFIVGGIIGIILALSLFEHALIALSALVGASLIVQATHFNPIVTGLLFLALLAVGIVIQAKTLPKKP